MTSYACAGVLALALATPGRGESPLSPPWGGHGHTIAARAAVQHLPVEMPAFFREAADQLVYLNAEPDRWRDSSRKIMDEAFRYDHYIDLENVPDEALDAEDRWAYLIAVHEAGVDPPDGDGGFLPFRIIELYQRLVTQMARWHTASPDERRWVEARVIDDAGILGHFVMDASQPHHTTIHFNGWASDAPNPEGFSYDRDLHSRFESAFVTAHLTVDDLLPRLAPQPERLGDIRQEIIRYIRDSNSQVERLYRLEREVGFDPEWVDPRTKEFVAERLGTGVDMLRAIWWSAWLESEGA